MVTFISKGNFFGERDNMKAWMPIKHYSTFYFSNTFCDLLVEILLCHVLVLAAKETRIFQIAILSKCLWSKRDTFLNANNLHVILPPLFIKS